MEKLGTQSVRPANVFRQPLAHTSISTTRIYASASAWSTKFALTLTSIGTPTSASALASPDPTLAPSFKYGIQIHASANANP